MVIEAEAGEEFAGSERLRVMGCPACGVLHAIPETLVRQAQQKREAMALYCPNGHAWHYLGTSDAQKLAEERERSASLTAALDQARAMLAGAISQ